MLQACPISFNRVDGVTMRIKAFFIGSALIAYLVTGLQVILYTLVVDFAFSIFLNKKFSLSYIVAKQTQVLLKLEPNLTDAAAKKLASYFGLIFFTLIAIADGIGAHAILNIISAILLFCIFLEVAFDYCLGCKIYFLAQRVKALVL
ncbi:MAG: DUF4395 family protein [Helicobacteraceae bacterium]|nr:DUF4395 family protein [Helicobacteraceae bacterium]